MESSVSGWSEPKTRRRVAEDPFFDREVDAEGRRLTTIDDWARQTRAGFDSHYRPGDHYFLSAERPYILDTIERSLGWS
jgi:surfactin synthase thioesterase subunit